MSNITAQLVKELREKSGAGMMDCKKALEATGGDLEKAMDELRKKGLKSVGKRASKVAAEGIVYSYIHANSKIGVMLELNCETDFVARGDEFQGLAKAIAMHIAWANPSFLDRQSVPAEAIEREKEVLKGQLKPGQEKMADKIIEGRLNKFYEDSCLLEQYDAQSPNDKRTFQQVVDELSAKIGEKIEVRRFNRFEVGEGIEKKVVDYAAEVREAAASVGA